MTTNNITRQQIKIPNETSLQVYETPSNKQMTITPAAHKFRRNSQVSMAILEMCNWEHIEEVNHMLDEGKTPLEVHRWIKSKNYTISKNLIEKYAKLRRKSLVDNVSVSHQMTILKPIVDVSEPETRTSIDKLKSEIDALDLIIQGGYDTLKKFADKPILPNTLMAAIKLKHDLTGGSHGFLTNYGMEHLRDIENKKFNLIIKHLISYIPEDQRELAISKIEVIEEEYYMTTEYYEEYLRSLGTLTEAQINSKLVKWQKRVKNGEILSTIIGH